MNNGRHEHTRTWTATKSNTHTDREQEQAGGDHEDNNVMANMNKRTRTKEIKGLKWGTGGYNEGLAGNQKGRHKTVKTHKNKNKTGSVTKIQNRTK